MSKLNIALVGAGRRGGGAHLPVIAKLKDIYNLVAICDIDEETATRYAKQYGATPYTNVRDLVAQEKLDVVDITVPGVAHHAIACFMADAGVHILCETPIAVTLPTADLRCHPLHECPGPRRPRWIDITVPGVAKSRVLWRTPAFIFSVKPLSPLRSRQPI